MNNVDPSGLFCLGLCTFTNAAHYVAKHKAAIGEIAAGVALVTAVVVFTVATGGLADAIAIGAAGASEEVAGALAGGSLVGLLGLSFPLDATLVSLQFVGLGLFGLGLAGYGAYSLVSHSSGSSSTGCR